MSMENQEDFTKFKAGVSHSKPREIKITGSWGIYDAYKLIRKGGWKDIGRPLQDVEFYKIIRSMNRLIAEQISLGTPFKMPHFMGTIELRKYKCGVSLVNDKLKVSYPIDWLSTLHLWHEDPEAHRNKTLIRYEVPYTYYLKYNNLKAEYSNKCFYKFKVNTFIKRALGKNINAGKVDALWEKMNWRSNIKKRKPNKTDI